MVPCDRLGIQVGQPVWTARLSSILHKIGSRSTVTLTRIKSLLKMNECSFSYSMCAYEDGNVRVCVVKEDKVCDALHTTECWCPRHSLRLK